MLMNDLCDVCEDNYATDVVINFGYKTYWCDDCTESQEG